jgi:hypothetical protein
LGGEPVRLRSPGGEGGAGLRPKPQLVSPQPEGEGDIERSILPDAVLQGARTIKIIVFQVFHFTDLSTSPDAQSGAPKAFYEFITNHRRELARRRGFPIDGLGVLKAVGAQQEENGGFWRAAISFSRDDSAPPLMFLPFELSLTEWLNQSKPSLESILDASLGVNEALIENKQVSGRLRVFAPGVGAARISITLTFKQAVHVAATTQIAHRVQELPFVDSGGRAQHCETLLLEVIGRVVRPLFGEEHLLEPARSLPPEIVYCFSTYDTKDLAKSSTLFAYLLSQAPGNAESAPTLEKRVDGALRSRLWAADSILALASQRASLFLIGDAYKAREDKRKRLLEWLTETSELIWVTGYTLHVLAKKIENIATLNDTRKPNRFEHLQTLLQFLCDILRAMKSVETGIRDLGEGVLDITARDLWLKNNKVDAGKLRTHLDSIASRLPKEQQEKMAELFDSVRQLTSLVPPLFEIEQGATGGAGG